MTPAQQAILDKINALREEYPGADADRRLEIIQEGKQLGKQLPQRDGCCINCNFLKALPPEHEQGRFCGAECHNEWADKTYGVKSSRGRKTKEDLIRQINEMKKREILRKHLGEQQPLL